MTLFLCLTFYCYNCAVEFLALVIIIGVNGSLILLMIKRDLLFSSRLLLSKNNLKHFKQNLKYLSTQHKKSKKGKSNNLSYTPNIWPFIGGIKCNDLIINHKTHIGNLNIGECVPVSVYGDYTHDMNKQICHVEKKALLVSVSYIVYYFVSVKLDGLYKAPERIIYDASLNRTERKPCLRLCLGQSFKTT